MNMNTQLTTNNECIFCKIARGEIPVIKVYEDENTLAFLDISPITKGHALIIPKKHVENMYTLDETTRNELFATTQKIAIAIKKGVEADGVNIGMNNEQAAGQAVFHAHVHIIPRHNNDGLRSWPGGTYATGQAETIARRIQEQIQK